MPSPTIIRRQEGNKSFGVVISTGMSTPVYFQIYSLLYNTLLHEESYSDERDAIRHFERWSEEDANV